MKILMLAFFSLFLAACTVNENESEAEEEYFITRLTQGSDDRAPESYFIDVNESTVRVGTTVDGIQEHELEDITVTEDTIEFEYDATEINLERESDSVYEDQDEVRYEVSTEKDTAEE